MEHWFQRDAAVRLPRLDSTALATAMLVFALAGAQRGALASSLTLDDALGLAEQSNAELGSLRAGLDAAQGELRDSRALLWHNPEVSAEVRERKSMFADMEPFRAREGSAGVSQVFEIAGQPAHRRRAAERSLDSLRWEIEEKRIVLRSDVERKFVEVLALQERLAMEAAIRELIERSTSAIRRRVEVGEDSRLEGNVAHVELERAGNQITQLREQLSDARAALATLLQLPPGDLPTAIGVIDASVGLGTLEGMLASSRSRPRLAALAAKQEAAESRLRLEKVSAVPDVTVSLNYGRERTFDSRDNLTTLSFSVPIPLFRQNAAGIGKASTELLQARIDRTAAEREVNATIRLLFEKLTSLRTRVERLRTRVLPALEENQDLSRKAFDAGELGLVQLLLVNRQMLDARRDLLEARTDLRQTLIALRAAVGDNATPDRTRPR